jgi:hypothetical protein
VPDWRAMNMPHRTESNRYVGMLVLIEPTIHASSRVILDSTIVPFLLQRSASIPDGNSISNVEVANTATLIPTQAASKPILCMNGFSIENQNIVHCNK